VAVAESKPSKATRTSRLPEDWPAEIRTHIFMRLEGDQWSAVDAEFSRAAMGRSQEEALASITRMMSSYVMSSLKDGVASYAEIRRPLPRRKVLEWHLRVKFKSLFKKSAKTADEQDLVVPGLVTC